MDSAGGTNLGRQCVDRLLPPLRPGSKDPRQTFCPLHAQRGTTHGPDWDSTAEDCLADQACQQVADSD